MTHLGQKKKISKSLFLGETQRTWSNAGCFVSTV